MATKPPRLQVLQRQAMELQARLAEFQPLAAESFDSAALRTAVAASQVGIWDWPDIHSPRFSWSPSFYHLTGYENGEIPPTMESFKKLIHADDLDAQTELFATFLAKKEPFRAEYRMVRKDGSLIWVEALGQTFFDDNGKPVRMAGLLRDISVQHKLQLQLIKSEERYRTFFETSPAGICIVSLRTPEILDANPSLCRMLGYSREEILGKSLAELTHPDDLASGEMAAKKRASGWGEDNNFNKRLIRKDGSAVSVRVFSAPLEFDGDQPAIILGIVLDLSEQIEAEKRSLEIGQRLELVLRSSGIGMWDWQVQDGMLELDEIWAEMLGYELEELQPSSIDTFFDFLHPDDLAVAQGALDRHFSGESEFYECQLRVKHRKGHLIWVLARGRVIEWGEGQIPLRMLGTHYEITDVKQGEEQRRKLEKQVFQAQKLESLGVLAGGIAHDFNNILMVIQGHAELARSSIENDGELGEYLDQINDSVGKAADLCTQMLAYSGKGSFLVETIDLNQLLIDLETLLRTSITSKIQLAFNPAPGPLLMKGDPTQIRQIVMNLVINAAEAYGDQAGAVTISTGARHFSGEEISGRFGQDVLDPGRYITLKVSDQGCGMSHDIRTRIFEPFFTTKFTGRGLGMSAVQGIVRAHEGGLDFATAENQGTEFHLVFPELQDEDRSAPSPNRSHKPALPAGKTVLVVDDESLVLDLTLNMLKSLGVETLAARDGREALQVHERHRRAIDCVLLDLTMPNLDGEETFLELRRRDPSLPAILCSGYSVKEVEKRFFGKGLGGFLHKPYTLEELQLALARIFAADH